ncbi:MAG: 50S ribosomal protein L17 [Candidatus Levyibacteriota bacterium]|nr:MAG: 50S ribosomal protein L17 [Candidatus Levybacteria bacterium]
MRKKVFGRKLKRDKNERKALFKSLMSALVLYGHIKTTIAKAKAIKGTIEKLVTKTNKSNKELAYRFLNYYLSSATISKFVNEVAPRFTDRSGGYTRIIKIGNRLKDNSKMALMEWTEKNSKPDEKETKENEEKAEIKKEKKPRKKETKKTIK